MQRRKWHQLVEFGKDLLVNPHWLCVLDPPVNNAMTCAGQPHFSCPTLKKALQMLKRAFVAEFNAFAP